jgi:hypothetical protein
MYMGLSIHYAGTLKEPNRLQEIVSEVADICDALHWAYDIVSPELHLPVTGIGFCPPGSEPVWLSFSANGSLINPYSYLCGLDTPPTDADALEIVMQYAGAETHMRLINLLRYLSQKYFDVFTLTDDSEYWESGNADKCRDWFEMFGNWMSEEEEARPLHSMLELR